MPPAGAQVAQRDVEPDQYAVDFLGQVVVSFG